jgi:hypothetical protein
MRAGRRRSTLFTGLATLLGLWPQCSPAWGARRSALAISMEAPIFDSTGRGRRVVGFVRRGNAVEIQAQQPRPRCWQGRPGRWYALAGGGFVCDVRDFRVAASKRAIDQRQPDLDALLPYTYARVRNRDALRFKALPPASALESAVTRGQIFDRRLDGDYLVAVDRTVRAGDTSFVRTIRGHYIREDELERFDPPKFKGESLTADLELPLAFVFGTDAPLFCLDGGMRECGRAEKHSRFQVRETRKVDHRLVLTDRSTGVEASHLRVARAIGRPRGVSSRDRWVHIDLSEQTLVAYEGNRAVYATLVSTGKDGFSTPAGLFHTQRKYLTRSMRGRDPVDGVYDVEEVPWVLFYHRGFALHGAYWHDDFGKVRSHGCTNLAPPDARWLYDWLAPPLPRGWHASNEIARGAVYITP